MFAFAEELEEEKESPTETELTEKQKHQLRHRELFLSRQYESLPATHIRYCARTCTHAHTHTHWTPRIIICRQCPWGVTHPAMNKTNWALLCLCFTWCLFPPTLFIRGKCSVALLNETEAVLSYLDKEVSQRKEKTRFVISYCIFSLCQSRSSRT